MSTNNGDFNPFDPAGMLKGVRDANMDAWAKMMAEFVNTDAYAEATAAMLDAWLTSSGPLRKVMETTMTQVLGQLNLPAREDVTRIAERLTNIEMRLDDMEAKLDEDLPQRPLDRGQRAGSIQHRRQRIVSNSPQPPDVDPKLPTFFDVCAGWHRAAENLDKFNRLTTTDAKIAQTPKELVWTLNKAKLYRYIPVLPPEERKKTPLLMVFAIMNRPHVLDLRPGHSYAEYMLRQGYDLYLLDWGVPGPEDRSLNFDDYTIEYLPRVIRKLKKVSGADEFSMLGWCLGALISTMYAALRSDDGLKNLILLTAPLDFADKTAGGFTRWSSNPAFNADMIVEKLGNVPGAMIDNGAKMLKPIENYFGSYLMLWDNIENPRGVEAWHAMNTWVRDIIPMAGGAYQQLINDFYKENRLMNGTMRLRGELVELSRLRANLLNVIAEADHITPPCQSERIGELVGSEDTDLLRVRGGHIGIMAGRGAEKNTWPHIESWLAARSD